MEDADYEEELLLVAQTNTSGRSGGGLGGNKNSAFANMTKEEKAVAAKELQKKLRDKRIKEDEENKAANAKAYAEAQKEMAKAKKINDEREFENAIAQ